MSRKATSMRGEVVDFDLFAIKEQINGAPLTETIQNREKFIDLKRRRGTKRKLQDMLAEQTTAPEVEAVEAPVEDEQPSGAKRKIIRKDA
jgi:hypothetical protein